MAGIVCFGHGVFAFIDEPVSQERRLFQVARYVRGGCGRDVLKVRFIIGCFNLNPFVRRTIMCGKWICLVSVGLVLCVAAGTAHAHLVAYWPMDEGAGTTVGDTTGAWDGTITGNVTWVDGKEGMALEFPGGQNYVNCGNVEIGPDLTLAYWCFNPEKAFERSIGQHSGNYTADPGWCVYSRNEGEGTVWFRVHGADDAWNGGDIIIPDILPKTEWYHLTFTFEGDTRELKGYLNGELKVSKICEEGRSIYPNTNDLRMGHVGTGEAFSGMLDEVAVWNHVLSDGEILAVMEGHMGGANPYAFRPDPADGAMHPNTWVTLSWRPGAYAVSHDIYLGESFDDVNDGAGDTFRGNQGSTFFVAGFPGFAYPDGLVPGTTYYWRVDEVNAADPNSPWKGDVWSFSIPPKTAYDPDPPDGAEFVDPNTVTLSWTAGFGAILHTVYFGDDYDEVNNATIGAPAGTTAYSPGPLEREKVYYWRVDEFDAVATHKGDVWSFTTPGAVGNPQPAYEAADVPLNATLNWTPADSAASHQLYLGTDKATVRKADPAAPEYKGSIAVGAESHDPGLLEAETTYYWRVDEVDAQGNTMKGPIWVFTTGAFLLIEDYESYTDDDAAGQAIWQTWIDGFGVADNGAQVGYLLPPYAEQTIVHGGGQSMPLLYVNEAGVTNSEGVLALTAPRDWTAAGVGELSLWFRGDSDNAAEPLYVAISNSTGSPAVMAYDDPSAATVQSWTQWRILLQAFADQGINLGDVDKIAIGLGSKSGMASAGGSGTMFIDDIRLYQP